MNELELKEIVGGASWGFWSIVGGAVSFLLGLYEGLSTPGICRR